MENELTPIKGLLVFYVDVGIHMPPSKAEDYVKRVKKSIVEDLRLAGKKIPDDVGVSFIAMRPDSETCIEYMSFNGGDSILMDIEDL